MQADSLVIDCDGHILEPPDLWEKYIDPKYRDRAMGIRVGDDRFEYLEIDGKRAKMTPPGLLGSLGGMGKRVEEAKRLREMAMRGGTREARRAGSHAASRPVAVSSASAAKRMRGSEGLIWNASVVSQRPK